MTYGRKWSTPLMAVFLILAILAAAECLMPVLRMLAA